jgi:hypothetical protein
MAGTTGASSPFNGGGHRNHLKHRMITHTHLIKWVGDEDKTGSRLLGRLTRLHPQAPLEFVQGSSAPEPHVTITTHLHPFASTMNVKSASAATDPPTDACSAEFDAANQCLSTYSTSSCVDCMNSVLEGLPDGGMTCTFFKEQICAGISMCGCTACQDELEESSSCIVSYACGLLDCTGSDQPTNTEPTDDCSSELDLASQCVSSMSSGEACAGCFNSVLEGLPDVIPCLSFESEMCSAIDTCGCTACKDELLDLLSCQAVNCDPLDCLEEPTEPVVCASEGEISGECISGIASSSICVNCLNSAADAIGDSFSCVEYTTGMCPAIATECDCGSCRLLIQDVSACSSTKSIGFIHLMLQLFEMNFDAVLQVSRAFQQYVITNEFHCLTPELQLSFSGIFRWTMSSVELFVRPIVPSRYYSASNNEETRYSASNNSGTINL